ncbi:MAG TPA: NUDIX hydrolase [Pirellulales bacterium]
MEESEILLETRRFRVLRRTHTLPDGRQHAREVIEHPGAVGIVPMVDDDHVCLIRNFRVAVGRWLIEVPAGTLEPGEPPLVTASRELIEETGFRAGQITPLCELLFSPGILHERMHLFLATQLTPGETRLEIGEQIERLITPWEEALSMIERGEIEDAKTVAALLFCDRWRRKTK